MDRSPSPLQRQHKRSLAGRGARRSRMRRRSRRDRICRALPNHGCLITTAELDPPAIIAFAETLKDQLCKAGRCPTYLVMKDHSHISEVMSPNTPDDSVTGPILKWIRSVK